MKSGCRQGLLLSEARGGKPSRFFQLPQEDAGHSWPHKEPSHSRRPSSQGLLPWVLVSRTSLPSALLRTPGIGFRAQPHPRRISSCDPSLSHVCKDPVSQKGHTHRSQGLELGHVFLGATTRPSTNNIWFYFCCAAKRDQCVHGCMRLSSEGTQDAESRCCLLLAVKSVLMIHF